MDDRFAPRRQEMLERLGDFLEPYVESMTEPEQRTHTHEYVQGLFSKLERKTGEAIAYMQNQDRQGLQQ